MSINKEQWIQPSGPARYTQNGWVHTTEDQTESGSCIEYVAVMVLACAIVLAVLAVINLTGYVTVFEDGSWIIGGVSGCIPWEICAL